MTACQQFATSHALLPVPCLRTRLLVFSLNGESSLIYVFPFRTPLSLSQQWRILLMLRSQVVLFQRYSLALQPFKYAGYPQLLDGIRQHIQDPATALTHTSSSSHALLDDSSGGSSSSFLSQEHVALVQAGTELCWLTCVSSPLNAQELTRTGGVEVLARLLSRWVLPWGFMDQGWGPGGFDGSGCQGSRVVTTEKRVWAFGFGEC